MFMYMSGVWISNALSLHTKECMCDDNVGVVLPCWFPLASISLASNLRFLLALSRLNAMFTST